MANPLVVDVYPPNGSNGIAIGDHVTVTFDQEMDLDSINTGTFILIGPDNAPVFGPTDVTPFDVPGFEDEDILSSPYFKGYVKATISYLKVNASGGTVDDDITDPTGTGDLWLTKAVLTPEKPLKQNVLYKCTLLGQTSGSLSQGIRTRTVFDTVFTGSGTGRLDFLGGYTGANTRTYTIEITTAGECGDAEYIWWESSNPLETFAGLTSTGSRELEDGIYVICDPDGTFNVGDKFTVIVKAAYYLQDVYEWTFNTGSGAIITPPSSSSATGLETYDDQTLRIISILPADKETNLTPETANIITIKFNKVLDATTVTDATVRLWSEPVNGIFTDNPIQFTGTLAKILNVNGDTLTIQLS